MNLALFDFDGTITTHDSFREFLFFLSKSRLRFCQKIMPALIYIIGFGTGIVTREKAKTRVCQAFLQNLCSSSFADLARKFVAERLNYMLRPMAMQKIAWHKANGDRVIIVSASFSNYLQYWCQQHQLELISTGLEISDGRLTGKFATPNCWGPEKVRRIKELLNLSDYTSIYAYGDSRGDREMLALAHHAFYRPFTD